MTDKELKKLEKEVSWRRCPDWCVPMIFTGTNEKKCPYCKKDSVRYPGEIKKEIL